MHAHDLPELLSLLTLSVVGPVLALRLKLPAPVVLILGGMALGPAAAGLVRDVPIVTFLSDLGFLVLMFMAGMEIDFGELRKAGLRALGRPALLVAAIFLSSIGFGLAADLSAVAILVVSATSVGMPLAVLQEAGRLRSPLGRHVMLVATLAEFVCIIAIVGYEVLARHGMSLEFGMQMLRLVGLFVACVVAMRLARAAVWWWPERFGRVVAHHDVAELGVRVGLLVMLAFVSLAALLGVEEILGAFLAGALVSVVFPDKHVLEGKVAALGNGLVVPLFFGMVGVRFDPRLLNGEVALAALTLVGIAAAVKVVPALLFGDAGLGWRARLAAGCLLAAPLTLVVAIGAIGEKLGILTPAQGASLVLVALVLSLVFPALFRVVAPRPAEGE